MYICFCLRLFRYRVIFTSCVFIFFEYSNPAADSFSSGLSKTVHVSFLRAIVIPNIIKKEFNTQGDKWNQLLMELNY